MVWGTVATTVRQRSVPAELLGRVSSVFFFASTGAAAIGAAAGSLVARIYGLTASFWIASATMTLLTVLAWRQLAAVDDDTNEAASETTDRQRGCPPSDRTPRLCGTPGRSDPRAGRMQ